MRKAKTLKRGFALFLAALMMFSSPVSALATESGLENPDVSISVPDETGSSSSSSNGENTPEKSESIEIENGNVSTPETDSSSSVPNDSASVPDLPELPASQPEQQKEYDAVTRRNVKLPKTKRTKNVRLS